MPVGQALLAGTEGAAFGFFPILWIVINAIWIYNMTVVTGHFDVLRRSFARVSDDQRIQAVIIAFCFGALLEALAGFGTPVAITSVMLIALGFRPIKAATVALVANTAPVAFGALAVPITTLATVTGHPRARRSAQMVGRQTPLLGVFVPMALVFIIDRQARRPGRRCRRRWSCGVAFALAQFVTSNYLSIAAHRHRRLARRRAAVVLLLRVWRPAHRYVEEPTSCRGGHERRPAVAVGGRHGAVGRGLPLPARRGRTTRSARAPAPPTTSPPGRRRRTTAAAEVVRAYAPYLIIIAIFIITQMPGVKDALRRAVDQAASSGPACTWRRPSGKPSTIPTFKFNWLGAAGHADDHRRPDHHPGHRHLAAPRPGKAYVDTYRQLAAAIVTVMAVLALAYVMNASGQTAHARHLDGRRRRGVRAPLADPRLARRRGDRLRHVVELAVRRPAGHGRQPDRARPAS